MAKTIRRASPKFLALMLAASMVLFYVLLVDRSYAEPISNRSDTLNNANISVTSNHTFQFTIANSLDTVGETASDTITITIDNDFVMGTIDCGDVDLEIGGAATSISSGWNGGNRDNRTNCPGSATAWGLYIDTAAEVLTIYTPTTVRTHVATGTVIAVHIGYSATFQDIGNEAITNPATTGFQTMTIGGTFGGSGTILVAIITGVEVSATIGETLTFTITGLPGISGVAGASQLNNCINAVSSPATDDEDAEGSINTVTTTATTVPFGTINTDTFYQGCLKTSLTTNANNGFTIRTRENRSLQTSGGATIPDANCNANGCLNTPSTAAAFTAAGGGTGFGISCVHSTTSPSCSTANPNWANGVNWAPIASEGKGFGPAPYASLTTATSVEVITKAKFRLVAPLGQGAGTYTNLVSFIATPTF